MYGHQVSHRPLVASISSLARIWARWGVAIAVVGLITALGVLLGTVLGTLGGLLWPAGRTMIEILTSVLAFDLGWWWYATAGQRWISPERRGLDTTPGEERSSALLRR